MARWLQSQPVYDAFARFVQQCLLDDRSLLWPHEQAWTPENVAEVKHRMVDAPVSGAELSFDEKLLDQMRGASTHHWMILADIYFVYFLPSSYIKPERKQHDIAWAAQQGGLVPPHTSDPIWLAQMAGFTRTSLKYHYKYAQFWLILLFAEWLKQQPDRQAVVCEPQAMQQALDDLLEPLHKVNRAYDMRHAMLHMAFPDRYERMISTTDKQRVVEKYGSRLQGPIPRDLDEAIQCIRQVLSPEHDKPDHPFDFYRELRQEWRPKSELELGDQPTPGAVAISIGDSRGITNEHDPDMDAVLHALTQTRNVILYGPPGTGKTYIARRAAEAWAATLPDSATGAAQAGSEPVMWTTFHQSYAYEDFVEGLRPVPLADDSEGVTYRVVPGVFRRACARAAGDPGHNYVLIVDEINRGNIAKILGELITLLEDDKRDGQPNALSVTLPYSGDALRVPPNLYVIGTMNTTDRSIALLDMALRRRFAFVELIPRPELLAGARVESPEASVPLDDLLRSLNRGICHHLDRDHQLGHSYFLNVARAPETKRVSLLDFVWNNQILPLLYEYFFGQEDRLAELLTSFRTNVETEGEAGTEATVVSELSRLRDDDLMVALARLAETNAG